MNLGLALTMQTLWNKWFDSASQAGFPTVIILVLVMGSMILLSLGIIGEYLSQIYMELKRRPHYVVREAIHPESDKPKRGG